MKKETMFKNGGIFILSVLFIVSSLLFLGSNNLMVGANAVFLLVGILTKNFINTRIRALIKVTGLTVFIGALPYFVNLNPYMGLIINFIGIFILLYSIVYNLNKSMYYPFLFGYTLLLTTNVTGRDLRDRLIGLALVGLIAVIFQIVYIKLFKNKKMFALKRSLDSLITYFEKSGNIEENLDQFMENNAKWSRELLEYRGRSYYLNYKENIELNLISILDKLENINTEILKGSIVYREPIGEDTLNLLKTSREFINEKIKEEVFERERRLYLDKYLETSNIAIYEFAETVCIFTKLVKELSKIENGEFKVSKKIKKNDLKSSIKILIDDFNVNSVRFVFSLRTAFLISIVYFIITIYHIHYGKWIIFTIASVSQPYNETIKNRAKDRFLGTIIGAGIYYFLSLFITTLNGRVVLVLIAVYLYIHFKKYIQTVSMITIMFLGLATLDITSTLQATEYRIFFIIIGCIITLFGNKFIIPYSLKKETKVLLKKYYECCRESLRKRIDLYDGEEQEVKVKNLILHARALENKILLNTKGTKDEKLKRFIEEERIIINSIQSSFNRIEIFDIRLKLNGVERMENIKKIEGAILNGEKGEEIFKNYLKRLHKNSEKLIYIDMYRCFISEERILKLKETVI